MAVAHHDRRRADTIWRCATSSADFTELPDRAEAIEADSWTGSSVWTTDHVLVKQPYPDQLRRDRDGSAWVGAERPGSGSGWWRWSCPAGTPSLPRSSRRSTRCRSGRLTSGAAGWSRREFANLARPSRSRARRVPRRDRVVHICWSGSSEPFAGSSSWFDDFIFGPLPAQRSSLPIWIGAQFEAALARVGQYSPTAITRPRRPRSHSPSRPPDDPRGRARRRAPDAHALGARHRLLRRAHASVRAPGAYAIRSVEGGACRG